MLKGKVAIVTGGGRGIGRAIALAFAREGAIVVVNDIDQAADDTAKEITSMGSQALAVKANVSNSEEVNKMIETVAGKFGRIDILVNNAGISMARPSEDLTEEEYDRVLDVNLKGVFLCSQAVGRVMIKQKSGRIINISSTNGLFGQKARAAYDASKGGVVAITRSLAVEWAKNGVIVNSIAPGWVRTEMFAHLERRGIYDQKAQRAMIREIPMKRLGDPTDIANTAIFLASDLCSYITGQIIVVDGGLTAYGVRYAEFVE